MDAPTARADGTYPVGRMLLTDFVTAERAAEEAPLDLRQHKTVEMHTMQKSKVEHESFLRESRSSRHRRRRPAPHAPPRRGIEASPPQP